MRPIGNEARDVVWVLARNVAQVRYQDLSSETVETTKKSILDTVGVIEGASGITPGLSQVVGLVMEAGGKAESTILGFGGKVPAWLAAFANGAMAHCLDYDDTTTVGHPSANTVPSGLAAAERIGNVSGEDFITAIALGNDLFMRLCSSVSLKSAWHLTPLFGVFAAAATSGKILGLTEEQMVDALGLAFCQAAGTFEIRFGVGSDVGGMRDAFPNAGGLLAALLAQKGIRGVRTCFEGGAGLFNVYFNGTYDRSALTDELGKKFRGAEVGFKPWPADGESHSSIDAALWLAKEHSIDPDQVTRMTVFVGEFSQHLCQPLDVCRNPTTITAAQYSIPYSVAIAVAKRNVTLNDYFGAGFRDPVVLQCAQRVTPKLDSRLSCWKGMEAGVVEIKTKSGRNFGPKRIDTAKGDLSNPMTMDELIAKFRDCIQYAARPIAKEKVEEVTTMVGQLENVENVSQLVRLLA